MAKRHPDAIGLLDFFWNRFDANTAPDEDLEYLSGAADEAANAALQLSAHISGIGGLIDHDQNTENQMKCGELQDTDQAALLYRIADELKVIGHLANIGSEADCVLRARMAEKLAASRSRRTRISEQSSALEVV